MANNQNPGMPTPDPKLKALDRFVGKWRMSGHYVGSDEENIKGEVEYRWLPGGFFMEQHIVLQFGDHLHIDSTELIGFDFETGGLKSAVYSNMSPVPLPYFWEIDGDDVKITVKFAPLDATFTGKFSDGGNVFSGGWRPNEGADPVVNAPYDVSGSRVK